jgi:L-amino acid N-acyltransferase YncA
MKLAVALRHRRQGGGVAQAAVEHVLRDIESCHDSHPIQVAAKISPENNASLQLARHWGFKTLDKKSNQGHSYVIRELTS